MPAHAPALHASAVEHVSWSLHGVPSGTWEATHIPLASHAPVLHGAIPVVHAAPGGMGTASQAPLTALHMPAKHPVLSAEQSLGMPPWHIPPWHVLPLLQRSPVSTHTAPFFAGSAVGSHLPVAGSQ